MTSAQQIAKTFGGDVCGNTATIPTSGHSANDRGTAITIDPNAPDGILVHCFNGGDPLAEKDRLREAGFIAHRETGQTRIEPSVGARFQSDQYACRSIYAKPQQVSPVTDFNPANVFEYVDLDGEMRYRVTRVDHPDGGKDFPVSHPDGTGGWKPGRNGSAILYRWLDLIAIPDSAVIYMAEGERKADKLAAWGFPATSSKNLPDDLQGTFQGRTVAVLPDNDEQGERIADKAVEKLSQAGATAFKVYLPDLPAKGDIVDWEGTPERLIELTEVAQRPPSNSLPMLDLAAMATQSPPARKWALEGYIPQGELTLFTGPGSAGKSLLAKQMSVVIAAGLRLFDIPAMQANSLYITCEDDADELHRRLLNIHKSLGVTIASMAGRLHMSSLRGRLGNELSTFDSKGQICPSDTFDLVANTIVQTNAKFVVLDNVAHLFSGNENDRSNVTQFCNLLNKLCGDTGTTILLIGHPNKAGDSYSGSTAWLNAVRSQISLERVIDSDGAEYDPDARVLSVGKANYARNGTKIEFRWHDWAFVLERELPSDYQKELSESIAARKHEQAFLNCLEQRNSQKRAVSERPSPTFAPTVFATMPEAKGSTKKQLEVAMDSLFRMKKIERKVLWKGPDRKDVVGLHLVAGNCAGDTVRERGEPK